VGSLFEVTGEDDGPYTSGHRYVNYLDADETGEERGRLAFGPNYDRLRQVKGIYDPDNVFHLNTNIPPA